MIKKINKIIDLEFQNVSYFCENFTGSKTIFQFEQLKEYNYYSKIILEIYRLLGEKFNDFEFLIYSKIAQKVIVDDSDIIKKKINNKTILFFISDETGVIPLDIAKKAKVVFKVYIKKDFDQNVYYFPLGYANGDQNSFVPFNKRKINVFFIGQLGRSRIKFYKHLANKKFIPDNLLLLFKKYLKKDFSNLYKDSFIKFTTNFSGGLNIEQYNELLNNSKIVVCPYGAVTEETFRHYEAMRAGCVVITLRMPEVFPYKNSPIIQLNNWQELNKTITHLLNNPSLLIDLHNNTINWWKEKCSEESVAKYIVSIIL